MSNFHPDEDPRPSDPVGDQQTGDLPSSGQTPAASAEQEPQIEIASRPLPGQGVVRRQPRKPIVTFTLIGFTVLIFVLQLVSETVFGGTDLPAMLGMKVNELIIKGQVWRLITPMFLHGSIIHLAFNMYALYAFGPGLELHSGRGRFLSLYFLSGFAGNVMSFLFTDAPSLGSSTAIFGLLGAEGIFLYQNRRIFGAMAQRALVNIVMVGLFNLAIGLSSPGIDNWGHIGGMLGGLLFAWGAGPVLAVHGAYPEFTVSDQREQGDVLRTGFSVGLLFTLLAVAGIFIQNR